MKNNILRLIEQYHAATTESNKRSIRTELFLQHLRLTAEERSAVWDAMQPFFDKIEQKMIEKDPLAQEAYELLNRHKTSQAVVGR